MRPFISLSGLDLSFLHAPAGNLHILPKPAKRRRKKAEARKVAKAKKKTAQVIDLAAVRKAKRLHLKARDSKTLKKVVVDPKASPKVKQLAKDLGLSVKKLTTKPKGKAKAAKQAPKRRRRVLH